MTSEEMLQLIRRYRGALRCWGYEAKELFRGESLSRYDQGELTLGHCITILNNAEALVDMGYKKKARSMVVFVQDLLYRDGLYDLRELRKHLRSAS